MRRALVHPTVGRTVQSRVEAAILATMPTYFWPGPVTTGTTGSMLDVVSGVALTGGAAQRDIQNIRIRGTGMTGGTFKLSLDGAETAAITWSATPDTLVANVDAALEGLAAIGAGGVVVSRGWSQSDASDIQVNTTTNTPRSLLVVTDNSITGTGVTITVDRWNVGGVGTLAAPMRGGVSGVRCRQFSGLVSTVVPSDPTDNVGVLALVRVPSDPAPLYLTFPRTIKRDATPSWRLIHSWGGTYPSAPRMVPVMAVLAAAGSNVAQATASATYTFSPGRSYLVHGYISDAEQKAYVTTVSDSGVLATGSASFSGTWNRAPGAGAIAIATDYNAPDSAMHAYYKDQGRLSDSTLRAIAAAAFS